MRTMGMNENGVWIEFFPFGFRRAKNPPELGDVINAFWSPGPWKEGLQDLGLTYERVEPAIYRVVSSRPTIAP